MQGSTARRVSRAELFFDLVAVAAVAQFIHLLQDEPGPPGLLALTGCYLAVWAVWFSVVLLVNVFGEWTRGFAAMGAGLAGIAVMGASTSRAVHGEGEVFAVAFLVTALFVAGCWARARRAEPGARVHPGHLRERFGLFILIVLGEAAVMLVGVAAAAKHWNSAGVAVAVAGAAVLASLAYVSLTTSGRRVHRVCNLPLLALALLFTTAASISLASGIGSALGDAGRSGIDPYGRALLGAGLGLFALGGLLRDVRVRRPSFDTTAALLPAVLMAAAVAAAPVPPWTAVTATVAAVGWRILWTHHRPLGAHRAGRRPLHPLVSPHPPGTDRLLAEAAATGGRSWETR